MQIFCNHIICADVLQPFCADILQPVPLCYVLIQLSLWIHPIYQWKDVILWHFQLKIGNQVSYIRRLTKYWLYLSQQLYWNKSTKKLFFSESVFNCSKKVLTEAEIKVLEKGLDHNPIQNKVNGPDLCSDFEEFCRRICLNGYFHLKG